MVLDPQLLDRLYALPLDEFTRTRDNLSKKLAEEGDRTAGVEVKKLRKPTAMTWVLNQVARRHPDDVGALLAAGDRLRRAQQEALAGERNALKEAQRELQLHVRRIVELGADVMKAEDRVMSVALETRMLGAVRAGAIDPEMAQRLRAGHLAEEPLAVGFADSLDVPAEPTQPGRTAPAQERDDEELIAARRQRDELSTQVESASAEAGRLSEEARRARQWADRAAEDARRADERLAALRLQVDEARRRVLELETGTR